VKFIKKDIIRKDIDKRLLLFVVMLLVLLASLTIYYEVRLASMSKRYNKDQQIFGGLTADAVIEQFNKTSNLKENVLRYKEYLEKRFDELNTLNKNLKNEVEGLKAELTLVKSQIEYRKAKELGPTEQFRLFQSRNDEITKLKEKTRELCSTLKSYNISDDNCVGVDSS